MTDTRSTSRRFDPARDGFGFRNPAGLPAGTFREGSGAFGRRIFSLLYGRGLCLGMAAAALSGFERRENVFGLSRTPELLRYLAKVHARQYRPRALLAVALYWLASRGGRPKYALRRLRVAGDPDPHIVCFGPASLDRRFFARLGEAHAVAPYRVEASDGKMRVFVYDPNVPKDRGRFILFGRDGTFGYEGFSSEGGWGITLLPLRALGRYLSRT